MTMDMSWYVKLHWCITGPVGPLGCTNQSWCGVKLLAMSVLTHPVGCGQHHSMHPNGRLLRLVSIVDSHSVFLELSSGVESVYQIRDIVTDALKS